MKDPSDKLDFFNLFHPTNSCFIVSDIKSKQFLEIELLKKNNFLPGSCVLRANEFYKEIFISLNKEWSLKSDSFVKQLLAEFLQSRKNFQYLAHSKAFFEGFDFCLSLFLQSADYHLFREWLSSRNQSLFPKYWLELFESFFHFLKSQNILYESAVKTLVWHYLSDFNPSFFKKESLIIDLAFSMDLCEKDIFKELSRFKDIYIISPELKSRFLFEDNIYDFYFEWEKEMPKEDVVYLKDFFPLFLKEQSEADSKEEKKSALKGTVSSFKEEGKVELKAEQSFSLKSAPPAFFKVESATQDQEVKQAAVQVCQWVNEGVSLNEIAVYSPNIEDYWFALKSYLNKESIPCKKTVYSSLLDFPEIKYILSALRLHLNRFGFEDLESFCFYKASRKNFSQFKAGYFKFPNRKTVWKYLFPDKIREAQKKVSGLEFIEWLLSFWHVDFSEEILSALLKTLKKLTLKELLQYQSWLVLFESEILLAELELEEEESSGLSCLSFNAFHSVKNSHVFLLGLTESAFKKSAFLTEDSIQSLLNDLGFPLAFKFPKEKEKNLLWFLQSSCLKEVYLSSYLYDFLGSIQNQSLIYRLSNPLYSAKAKEISNTLSYGKQQRQKNIKDILKDKTQKQIQAIESAFHINRVFFHVEKNSLSASRLQTYNNCPFKYAGEKLFYVKERKPVDWELSALAKGISVHKLFQLVLEQYPNLDLDDKQMEDLIQQSLPDKEEFIYKQQIVLMKEHLKQLLEQFLLKERQQREDYPSVNPIAFEAELKACWNQKEGQLSSQGDYLFKGKIDRIDRDEASKTYVIRDYKASKADLTHISSWIKKNDLLQLVFYAQALKKGLVSELPSGSVSVLFYSIYNEDFLEKGFVEKEGHLQNFLGDKTSRHKKPQEFLMEVIDKINQKTQQIVSEIEQGNFFPQPKHEKLCATCFYKKWCRVNSNV